MKYTENLNLGKPDQDELYDVDDFNHNADIIDEKFSELNGKMNELEQVELITVTAATGISLDYNYTRCKKVGRIVELQIYVTSAFSKSVDSVCTIPEKYAPNIQTWGVGTASNGGGDTVRFNVTSTGNVNIINAQNASFPNAFCRIVWILDK